MVTYTIVYIVIWAVISVFRAGIARFREKDPPSLTDSVRQIRELIVQRGPSLSARILDFICILEVVLDF